MLNTEKKLILFFTFALLGIIVAIQFKSTMDANKQKLTVSKQIESLLVQLESEKEAEQQLRKEVNDIIAFQDNFYTNYLENAGDDSLRREWNKVRLKAELLTVKGPGVVITLDDAPAKVEEVDTRLLIIHDQDIKIILNELKKSGAQAISINGERITPMSEQICAGPTILINKSRYPVPYVINVIGDPDLIVDILSFNERINLMRENNIKVEIKKQAEVIVPKYNYSDKLETMISALEVQEYEN